LKRIAILGSTGSIGTQTLDVVRNNKDMKVTAVSANRSTDALEKQIREFEPELAVLYDEKSAADLKTRVSDTKTKVLSGMDGLVELASMKNSDILVTAVVGMIGIRPTLAGIEAGKDIALANKETLVTAGHLIMKRAEEKNVQILPVDSEHSAIFQCLHGEDRRSIHKLLITASGGPFRGMKTEQLKDIRPEDALKHPTWSMGRKITIDSATLVNKGLEVMEAHWLFGVGLDQIQVVVQPQSIIHSMVEFEDGAVMAQLGSPDMRLPIQYALCYPERRYLPGKRLDFETLTGIEIDKPDMDTFKGLPMAIEAAKAGGSMPTVFNAANEEAVGYFLDHRIGFLDIYRIIQESMDRAEVIPDPDLDTILTVEKETRDRIRAQYGKQ
jgi:1-deoxy-D-xylulose-5-phosphate reductoisomerase